MALVMLAGCGNGDADFKKGNKVAGLSVHDPAVIEDNGKYYIFGSHMAAAESEDLVNWKSFADGVNARNPVLGSLFEDMKAFDYTGQFTDGSYAVWAPDVIYNEKMGKYVMYFCTSHDYMTSALCMAVSDEVKGPYTYVDTFLYSGFSRKTVEQTNFFEIMGEDADIKEYLSGAKYNNLKYPNCIDANIFKDKEGKMWLSYGSWSGGIWLFEIDEETGYPIHPEASDGENTDRYFGTRLIGGLHNSCEGPYIYYDKNSDYYYLTVSYGELTREGGYQIRVFRSKDVTGPYVDTCGETLKKTSEHYKYGLKMMGNYMLPSLKTAYMAPGHNSILQTEDGKTYIIHHQRFDSGSEYHEPRVHQLFMTENGWPVAAPFATNGESLSEEGYTAKELEGTWYILSHGTDISKDIHSAEKVSFKNGKIKGETFNGTYSLKEGTVYADAKINDAGYSAVLLDMKDEAGNDVRCFMAVGDNNETVWAIMFRKN